jgi:hypothetical protein
MVNEAFVEICSTHQHSFLKYTQFSYTYTLRNPKLLTSPRQRQLTIWMRQFRHRSRTHKNRHLNPLTQQRSLRINMPDIPQQSRTKPYPVKETLIRISRDEVRGC